MDSISSLLNENTRNFSETQCDDIVLQNCQDNYSDLEKQCYSETHHQFDIICEDSQFDKPISSNSQENPEIGFRNKFQTPEKTSQEPNSPTKPSQSTSTQLHISPSQKTKQSAKVSTYLEKKKELQQKSEEFQRNFQRQQKLFTLCFEYMNESVANKIAQESGIATEAFLKRKKEAQRNNKIIKQFIEMIDCESSSSWSSIRGRKRRNWFRRVSRKDVKTVFEYLKGLNKEEELVGFNQQEKLVNTETDGADIIKDQKSLEEINEQNDSKDLIEHLCQHSLFIQNLPPRITYSQLEKYLQGFGEISHFMILDNFGRRKSNEPVALQSPLNQFNPNRFNEQSKIIGFVEFVSVQSVQNMLSQMKERKLRYYVKQGDTFKNINEQNDTIHEIHEEQSIRKTSIQSDSLTLQDQEGQKSHHGSKKIYVRQLEWEQMLKPQEKFIQKDWMSKKKQQNAMKLSDKTQELVENDNDSVVQCTDQIPSLNQQPLMDEKKEEESIVKQKNLEKLNMLRLKLNLIKPTTVKEEPLELTRNAPQPEPQTRFNLNMEQQDSNQEKINSNAEQQSENATISPNPIIQEAIQNQVSSNEKEGQNNDNQAQKNNENKQNQSAQTQKSQARPNSTQTDCHTMLGNHFLNPHDKQHNDEDLKTIRRRCEQCQVRSKRVKNRSIQKQVHITVGVKFSTQIPYRSALSSFHQQDKGQQFQCSQVGQKMQNKDIVGQRKSDVGEQQIFEQNQDIVQETKISGKMNTQNELVQNSWDKFVCNAQNQVVNQQRGPLDILEEVVLNEGQTIQKAVILESSKIVLQNRNSNPAQCEQITTSIQQPIQLECHNEVSKQLLTPNHIETQQLCTYESRLILIETEDQQAPTQINVKSQEQSHKSFSYLRSPLQSNLSSHGEQNSQSLSSIYSSPSANLQQHDPKLIKPKSFFDYSLWESDQQHQQSRKNHQIQLSENNPIQSFEGIKSIEINFKINKRLQQNGLSNSPLRTQNNHFQEGKDYCHQHSSLVQKNIQERNSPKNQQNTIQASMRLLQEQNQNHKYPKSDSSNSSAEKSSESNRSPQLRSNHNNPQKAPHFNSRFTDNPQQESKVLQSEYYKPRYPKQNQYKHQSHHDRFKKDDFDRHSKRNQYVGHGKKRDQAHQKVQFGDRYYKNSDYNYNHHERKRSQREDSYKQRREQFQGRHNEKTKHEKYQQTKSKHHQERESRNTYNERDQRKHHKREQTPKKHSESSKDQERTKERQSRHTSRQQHYERTQRKQRTQRSINKHSSHKNHDQKYSRNYDKRSDQGKGSKFSSDRNKDDEDRTRRNPQKQIHTKKWKYSEYMQRQKSPERSNKSKKQHEERNY